MEHQNRNYQEYETAARLYGRGFEIKFDFDEKMRLKCVDEKKENAFFKEFKPLYFYIFLLFCVSNKLVFKLYMDILYFVILPVVTL